MSNSNSKPLKQDDDPYPGKTPQKQPQSPPASGTRAKKKNKQKTNQAEPSNQGESSNQQKQPISMTQPTNENIQSYTHPATQRSHMTEVGFVPRYAPTNFATTKALDGVPVQKDPSIFGQGLSTFNDLKNILIGKSGPEAIKVKANQIIRTQLGDFYQDGREYRQIMTSKPPEPEQDLVIAGYIDNGKEIKTLYLEKEHEAQTMIPLSAMKIEGELGRAITAPSPRFSEGHHHGVFGGRSLKHKRRSTAKRGKRR